MFDWVAESRRLPPQDHAEVRWVRATRSRPCAICGKPDWCGAAHDGSMRICMRIESPLPSENGGWIHHAPPSERRESVPPPRAQRRRDDCGSILARWGAETDPASVDAHAAQLGVSGMSLRRLGVAWSAAAQAWAFPMRDAAGRTVGIRLREPKDEGAAKWAVKGSASGVFVPAGLRERPDPLVIAEGPTDTAALLDLGYDAVGRPSALGQERLLVDLSRRLGARDVVIAADRGDAFGVGVAGAERLADELAPHVRCVRVVAPVGHKDMRRWTRAGATRTVVDAAIACARIRWPRRLAHG